ncbi:MAG: ATP-binding cassette domain-containing protein [Pseudomonadota bacterium]
MLTVTDLALARAGRILFEGLSFAASPGQRVGVVGPNGCGKSSLFASLAGVLEPECGTVARPSGWSWAMVAQESPHGAQRAIDFVIEGDPEIARLRAAIATAEAAGEGEVLTRLHEQFDAAGGYAGEGRAGALLHGLGFAGADGERSIDDFSGGWRSRLALARTLFRRADLLLLDEPTNHLDLPAIDWLADFLNGYPGVVLCVSHDRAFLDAIATQILWIDRPAPRFYAGHLSLAEAKRAEWLSQEQAAYARNVKQAAHLQRFVDRFRAKATKARQAQSRLKMLERLEINAPLSQYAGYQFAFPDPERVSTPLLTLDHADLGYGDTTILHDVHLGVLPGDRIGLIGANGAGKSTLMKALGGVLDVSGRHAGRHLAVGYFAQHQLDQLDVEATPLDHFRRLDDDAPEQRLRDFLGGFGFHGDHAVEPIAPRSGGEKARLALALLAWQRPNLLLLDEPTNHLDLQMRDALATALQAFAGAVVLVSHDRAFLESLSDTFLQVGEGRVMPAETSATAGAPTPGAETSPGDAKKQRRRAAAAARQQLAPLKRRVTTLETELAALQERHGVLEAALADPAIYEDAGGERVQALSFEAGQLQQRIDAAETDWFEAQEALDAAPRALDQPDR